mmetsp:Transcript_17194/g.58366  ORF Transcript_17194/g.58366 Transcript_17194/m.58366 type:complete len:142 (-) Transcript_17194:45-470(-)
MSNSRFARPLYHLIDAKGQVIGRLASRISPILQGMHKPNYCPNFDCGDHVVVINAASAKFTGKKFLDKRYYWHTGYPGGIRSRTPRELINYKPEEMIRHAVLGMLPKNRLRKRRARKLHIYPQDRHLHEDELPPGSPSILG